MHDQSGRVSAINGLRGFAILGVIWHHTVYKLWLQPETASPLQGLWEPLSALLNSGWLGVNLFFMLSGFVLYLPFANGRRDSTSQAHWMNFYRRRAVRLLPLYYVSLLVFLLADVVWGRETAGPQELARYLTLTFTFFADTFFPRSNWVLWSLGVEIWFSVLFPMIVYLIARYGIMRILIATLILSLLVRVVGSHPEILGPGDRLNPIKDGILGRLDDFLVGMWICDAYVSKRLEKFPSAFTALVGGCIGVLSFVMWEKVIKGDAPSVIVPLLHNGVQIGSATLIVAALTARRKWVALLTNSPMQIMGMMCFSIYVWHGRFVELLLQSNFDLLALALYVASVSAIAAASYRFIEFPGAKSWSLLIASASQPQRVADQRR